MPLAEQNMKTSGWQELTRLTQGSPMLVERVRLVDSDISIEGSFELPPLARLPAEDQVFIMAFVKSDGSIKDMEKTFGISYPTVKGRLSRIASQFQMVETVQASAPGRDEVIASLERGEISAAQAIERLSK
jgi:hypothetical protein